MIAELDKRIVLKRTVLPVITLQGGTAVEAGRSSQARPCWQGLTLVDYSRPVGRKYRRGRGFADSRRFRFIAITSFLKKLACIEGISARVFAANAGRERPGELAGGWMRRTAAHNLLIHLSIHHSRQSVIDRALAPPGRLFGGPSNRQPIVFENVDF